ncbi:hypothetical protein LUZ60_001193 [Juncus effusus]|nr:hypothetical protein LUZ60_001193 [Juncus effusus]
MLSALLSFPSIPFLSSPLLFRTLFFSIHSFSILHAFRSSFFLVSEAQTLDLRLGFLLLISSLLFLSFFSLFCTMYQFQTVRSMGDNGAAAPAAAVMSAQDEADKEKRRRRSRNRGSKKNAPLEGGVGTSNATDSICGPPPEFSENGNGVLGAFPIYTTPPKASNITFNSLPQMELAEGIDDSAEIKGESSQISQSCPLPSSAPTQSREFNAGLKEGKKCFDPHWPEQAVNDAIKKGSAFKAKFRVNAHNLAEAYCTVDGISIDIMINGIMAQNRAIEGDTVAITLDPVSCWNKMRGQNVNCNQTLENGPFTPENKTHGLNKNGSFSISPLNPNTNNGHASKPLENPCETQTIENGEFTRALERIKAVINSNPNKRPTGRVISIIKKSPRRNAVVGFFSTKPLLQPSNNSNNNHYNNNNNHGSMERKNTISLPALHLVPNDPRLPKMAISIKNLPESTKERIRKGDINLEKELIAAKIDEWKEQSLFPKARVINILGKGGDIEAQIAAILFEHSIRISNFSPESLVSVPDPLWKVPESEIRSRRDLRKILTFTIDPSTAVDLDDALSVEILPSGTFRVGVHIADVAHFVQPGTDLDAEARLRSTSVYIIQNKVSMLPKELSQGCVSLTPGLDRLALSVIWDIDFNGNILDRWIGKSVIFSSCQLSYDLVQEMINTGFNSNPSSISRIPKLYSKFKWEDAVNSVRVIYELSKRLKETRFRDGALRLDNLKLSFLFDEEGTPYDTYKDVERKEAYSLIEEFMLLANISVAEVISSAYPDCALLRRHPEPNLRRLKEFEGFCAKYGFDLDASSSGQLHLSLSKIREKLQDDPLLFDILVYYACKPMLPASYFCTGDLKEKKDEWGHYALSAPFYTHFTSPIRRYADVIVHRTLYAVFDADEALKKDVLGKCFTGIRFDEKVAESKEGKEALREGKEKFRVLEREILGEVAEYCNERKLAARHAEEAGQKLYLWALLKKKEFMVSEARVMGLGPKFMTVYVQKLAGERRIYYDEVEGLVVDWLENTGTLLLDLRRKISFNKKGGSFFKHKPLEEFALIQNPAEQTEGEEDNADLAPSVFPMVLRNLSSVPVALHAIGGDDGPIDVAVRVFACSYFH